MAQSISDVEFTLFQTLIRELAGVSLTPAKKILLVGRLTPRLQTLGCSSFAEYHRLLVSGKDPDELQRAIDLLTTHETYFFREPQHFAFLRDVIVPERRANASLRVWSAACSSGEEAYSAAMVLADRRPNAAWDVFATDISRGTLAQAQEACYPAERARLIPPELLRRYCLKGVRSEEGRILVEPDLARRVVFAQANLTAPIRNVGLFDVIFLRNVLIYFDADTRRRVIDNLIPCMKPDGYLIVGHSESLTAQTARLKPERPTVYRLAAA